MPRHLFGLYGSYIKEHLRNSGVHPYARWILVFGGVILCGTSSLAQRPIVGWTVTTNVTTDSGDHANRTSMATRQQIASKYMRTEYTQVAGTRGPLADAEGMYMVFRAADTSLLMVMPQQHLATITGMGPMLSPIHSAIKSGVDAPDTRSINRKLEDLGAGERILGHATRHVRVTATGTVSYANHQCTSRVDSETEYWIAPDVDIETPMTESMKSVMPGLFSDDLDPADSSASDLPKGTEMRVIRRAHETDAQGNPIVVTTTTEIVELRHGVLADSLFQPPKTYQVMDTRQLMKDMPAGFMDSIMTNMSSRMSSAVCGKKP